MIRVAPSSITDMGTLGRSAFVVACFLAPTLALAGDKIEVLAERQIPAIPHASPFGQTPFDPIDFGALSPDGRFVLIIKAGRLSVRPLESEDEKQILPQG